MEPGIGRLACLLLLTIKQALVEQYGHRFDTTSSGPFRPSPNTTHQVRSTPFECNQCHFLKEQCPELWSSELPGVSIHHTATVAVTPTAKQLPVTYFMVTFTFTGPASGFAFAHPQLTYNWLFPVHTDTLKTFSANDPKLGDAIGMTGVLHTHTRKLDYHPMCILSCRGGYDVRHRSWLCKRATLLNGKALAQVFRGKFLAAMSAAGFTVPKGKLPWVAQAKAVGRGEKALQYLSRYLYRGVIADKTSSTSHRIR